MPRSTGSQPATVQVPPSNASTFNSSESASQSTAAQPIAPQPESSALGALSLNITTHTQQQSPLFNKLPPEIRNRIYELTFECELDCIHFTTIIVTNRADLNDDDYDRRWLKKPGLVPYLELTDATRPPTPILRSCQSVHNESIGLFKTAVQRYWDKESIITMEHSYWNAAYSYRAAGSLSHIRNRTFRLRNGPLSIDLTYRLSGDVYAVEFVNNSFFEDGTTRNYIDSIFHTHSRYRKDDHTHNVPWNSFNTGETLRSLQYGLMRSEPILRRIAKDKH